MASPAPVAPGLTSVFIAFTDWSDHCMRWTAVCSTRTLAEAALLAKMRHDMNEEIRFVDEKYVDPATRRLRLDLEPEVLREQWSFLTRGDVCQCILERKVDAPFDPEYD
jgi:hypothetical protein